MHHGPQQDANDTSKKIRPTDALGRRTSTARHKSKQRMYTTTHARLSTRKTTAKETDRKRIGQRQRDTKSIKDLWTVSNRQKQRRGQTAAKIAASKDQTASWCNDQHSNRARRRQDPQPIQQQLPSLPTHHGQRSHCALIKHARMPAPRENWVPSHDFLQNKACQLAKSFVDS